jgi:hypothetical protein
MRDAPELRDYLRPFWLAFEELSTCRGYMGLTGHPGPIPWTAICRYADKHGFAGEAFDDLVAIVRATDDAFLAHQRDKAKSDDTGAVRAEDGAPGGPGA